MKLPWMVIISDALAMLGGASLVLGGWTFAPWLGEAVLGVLLVLVAIGLQRFAVGRPRTNG